MLSSSIRPISRAVGLATPKNAPTRATSTLKASHAPSLGPSAVSTPARFYAGGHHHHEEAPKPYKRSTLSPIPADAEKSAAEREREAQGVEGWIFGRKVQYIDPLKPIEDTPEQKGANGWMWNRKPRAPGESAVWEDWEPMTYIGTAIAVLMVAVTLWSRPESNIQYWAEEEARERKIIKKRQELELKEEGSL